MNEKHEANRKRWNAASPTYSAMQERSGNWRRAATVPGWAFLPQELAILGEVAGKRACVRARKRRQSGRVRASGPGSRGDVRRHLREAARRSA